MTRPRAADDYDAISTRLAEMRCAHQPETKAVCPACDDGGWTCYGIGIGDPHVKECETCGNPEGYEHP